MKKSRRPVIVRFVPAPPGHDFTPAFDALAQCAGFKDLDAAFAAKRAEVAAPTSPARP